MKKKLSSVSAFIPTDDKISSELPPDLPPLELKPFERAPIVRAEDLPSEMSLAEFERAVRPHRQGIDRIDVLLIQLFNDRAQYVKNVGTIKHATGRSGGVLTAQREADIIRTMQSLSEGPLSDDNIRRIWVEIMSVMRGLEGRFTVAYPGPAGSMSEEAARSYHGTDVNRLCCPSVKAVFEAIEAGQADVGVVPFESAQGICQETRALLRTQSLHIYHELKMADPQHPESPQRLLCIGYLEPMPSHEDKTSVLCTVADTPEAKANLLTVLSEAKLPVTRVDAYPASEGAQYVEIDFMGHRYLPAVKAALEALESHCQTFQWLGSYPTALQVVS